jgi:hypothetical protein
MNEFKKEGYYHIWSDVEKNRFHLYYYGNWKNPKDFQDYVPQVKQCVGELKDGCSCLVVLDPDAKPPKLAFTNIHKIVQKTLIAQGVKKTAVVVNMLLAKMSLKVINRFVGMDMKTFDKEEDAINWLDKE